MFRRILFLSICLSVGIVYSDINYRLNTPIKPSEYTIQLRPYFDTNETNAFTFEATVTIKLTTENNTDQIKLHSQDLIFTAANITVINGQNTIALNESNPLVFDEMYTFAYINLASELQSGVEYTLVISYTGPIRSDLNGFYRNHYTENGVNRWLGATQMEPTHARKVFPCFDEPDLKATFTMIIDRPQEYQPSLANTMMESAISLGDGYIRETFYPSPRMSTYLVAFLVSEFQAAHTFTEGTKVFRIYTRPEAMNQSDYAFDFGLRVVNALGDYFGIDYYSTDSHLKLDHVALPDFRAGAMENWGLIKYRESLLMYVSDVSNPYFKYRVAQIVAHETTHMWFGNLVTCHWWSNTWLNEGFANYFQDYITSLIEPEVGSGNALITGSVYAAYDADESPNSPAITNENVNSPAEISGHFGAITYQKAGSVIRMIHHLIGDEAFKIGLNAYLMANQFDAGYPEKMYEALEQGVASSNFSEAPKPNVTEIMSSWISQAGHPILQVDVDYEEEYIHLTQKRFYVDSTYSTEELYKIPITFTTELAPDFENTKPAFVMDTERHIFSVANISEGEHSWIIFNIQETGLYRVNYDDHSWNIIANALRGNQRTQIHHLNRAKIVNDLFAFLYGDLVRFNTLHDVLEFLNEETDYSVWLAAIRGFNKLRNTFIATDVLPELEDYILRLMDNVIENIGYVERSTDDFETLRNRMQILEFACNLDHQGCIENSVALFRGLRDNSTEIAPSLRPVAYCHGLRFGNGEDYDFLWTRMASTNVANEAWVIGDALGCTTDEAKLRSYLVSMLDENSPIKTQDLTVPLTSILANHSNVNIVLEGLQQNYTLWSSIYFSMETVLTTVSAALHTEEEFAEFESWLASCTECSEASVTAANSTLALSRHSTAWANSHRADLLSNLRSNVTLTAPSLTLLVISVLTVMFKFGTENNLV